jgi:nitrite reductase (NADH) small subunit
MLVKHAVLAIDELPCGEMRTVMSGNVSIVLARTADGAVHALRNRCSHMGARLEFGRLERLVVGGEVGRYELAEEFVLRCPWHGYEFSLLTGRCVADPGGLGVRRYEASVEDGMIVIDR